MSARYELEDGWKRSVCIFGGEGAEAVESRVLVRLPLVVGRDISAKISLHECGAAWDALGVLSLLLGGVGEVYP